MSNLSTLKNYSFADVALVINGIPITGFGDGGGISIEPMESRATLVVGDDGHMTRVASSNRAKVMRVTLAQSSTANDALSGVSGANFVFSVGLVDGNGTSVLMARSCFISDVPSAEFREALTDREWTITMPFVTDHIGGNTTAETIASLLS